MICQFSRGKRFVWSYLEGACPHTNTSTECNCAKKTNVLKDGKMIRIVNGRQKPVYKASEAPIHPDATMRVQLWYSKIEERGQVYIHHMKQIVREQFITFSPLQARVVQFKDFQLCWLTTSVKAVEIASAVQFARC